MGQKNDKITLMYPWKQDGYCPEAAFYPELTEPDFHRPEYFGELVFHLD